MLTDQGSEFEGEFDALLLRCFIDHRRTSANHPQADGLAERAVQTVKRALRRLCEQHRTSDWEAQLPWLALGYRCSVQQSTGYSPYQLLYATRPTIPPAVRERFEEPIDFDDQASATDSLMHRMELCKRQCITAWGNLLSAQHRDTLRYARIRGGEYKKAIHEFHVGDYVYVQRASKVSLQVPARPIILRMHEARPSVV